MKKLSELDENYEFKIGIRLRCYNVGLSVKDEKLDYYDYILAYALWFPDEMMLVNITDGSSKAGGVYGGTVALDRSSSRIVVEMKNLKYTLGDDLKDWYLIE